MAQWYVIRTKAGRHDKAMQDLDKIEVEAFCPKMRREIRHHQTKRWIMREFPLFTGYVFANLNHAHFGKLRDMKDVLCVLGDGAGSPIPVDCRVVSDILDAEARGDFDELRPPVRRIQPGATVQIKDGILSGHHAAVTSVVGRRAIKAVVEILGSMREVEISIENLKLVA